MQNVTCYFFIRNVPNGLSMLLIVDPKLVVVRISLLDCIDTIGHVITSTKIELRCLHFGLHANCTRGLLLH